MDKYDITNDNDAYVGLDLSYFGARYYDQEIGKWISTDPAKQFHDLYAYAGNGFNPIGAIDPNGEDVYYLNASKGAGRMGHSAVLVGNKDDGYFYYSKEGTKFGNFKSQKFSSFEEFKSTTDLSPDYDITFGERYDRVIHFTTGKGADADMLKYANENYNTPYNLKKNNCGDLAGETLGEGGKATYTSGQTIPNNQYDRLKDAYKKDDTVKVTE